MEGTAKRQVRARTGIVTIIVLLVLFALLLVNIGVRLDRKNEERAFHAKMKADRAKGPYLDSHPRPEWDGSSSGETK